MLMRPERMGLQKVGYRRSGQSLGGAKRPARFGDVGSMFVPTERTRLRWSPVTTKEARLYAVTDGVSR